MQKLDTFFSPFVFSFPFLLDIDHIIVVVALSIHSWIVFCHNEKAKYQFPIERAL